jgi:hypothetical protein
MECFAFFEIWAYFCWVLAIFAKIDIRNLDIFLLSACDFRENRYQDGRTVLMGPNLNCVYACTVERDDILKTKYVLETSVTSHTACLKSSSVSSPRFHWRKRDLTAAQHTQLRAHTITQTRTPLQSVSGFATRKYFCEDKSKVAPPPARHGGTDPPIL